MRRLRNNVWFIVVCFIFLVACNDKETANQKSLQQLADEADVTNEAVTESKEEEKVVQKESSKEEQHEEKQKEESDKEKVSTSREKGVTQIHWGEFFDNEEQNKPSEKFWDLKGSEVEIKGWMGEVLSLGQGWFLLISAPGADCPFCSDDESYWNEIMIVFVKDKKNLRYTKEPLLVKGKLDVGIKIDESNYKTMFRLYDATFEPM